MILIGTSGYSFPDWNGVFYPQGMSERKKLAFYAEEFPTVEINTSYYRLPTIQLFRNMQKRVPPEFCFWIKLYQGLTHEKQIETTELHQMIDSLAPLEATGQLAGLLAQFPYSFRNEESSWERIQRLTVAAAPRPLAVEFRHQSWDRPEVYRRISDMGITYCIVDEPQISGLMPPTVQITFPIAYFRFHGRNQKGWWGNQATNRYDYSYSQEELNDWRTIIKKAEPKVKKVFVFFNNCHAGQAAKNAQTLREMLGQPLPSGRLF